MKPLQKGKFTSQRNIWLWLLDGGKVANNYSGVVYFFSNDRLESGISLSPLETFFNYRDFSVAENL